MAKQPNWKSLEIFLTSVELGSMAKAASRCGIAYSAAAKRIQMLEAQTGTPLLDRHARGVAMTSAGEAFARRARALFDLAGQLDADMRAFAAGGVGTVRLVATASAIGGHDLPEVLAGFAKDHPGVIVELREQTSLPILQDIFDGRADLGLITSSISIPRSLEAAVWRKDKLIAATAVKGSLLRKKKAKFNEILDCPLVEVMEFSALAMALTEAAEQLGRKLVSRFHVSSTDAARRLASTGQAVTVLPNGMVEPYRDGLGLRCIEIDEKWATRHLRLLSRPAATLPAAARLLRDCLLMG